MDNPVGPLSFNTTSLILLTLDVQSNRPNSPTFVDLDFTSEDAFSVSTFVEFICWGEFQLSVDPNLTQQQMATRKGAVASDQAVKVPLFGISDTAGPVTLLGLVQTDEGPAAGSIARSYIFNMFNNSVPIPTHFVPTPSPNFLP